MNCVLVVKICYNGLQWVKNSKDIQGPLLFEKKVFRMKVNCDVLLRYVLMYWSGLKT